MRATVTVSFGVRGKTSSEVLRILAAADQEHALDPDFPLYSLDLPADSPELEHLRSVLAEYGIKPTERIDYEFSEKEIDAADLVLPILLGAEVGHGGPKYGTAFDLSGACPACGTGAVQVGPLRLRASDIPAAKKAFYTFDDDWLVAEGAVERLKRLSGIELRQAEEARSRDPLPWFQLLAGHELPPVHPDTRGLKPTFGCKSCRRDGYFHSAKEPPLIVYDGDAVDVEALPDVSRTFERFGRSVLADPFEESHFAQPHFVVKPNVVRALRAAGIRRFQAYPVTLAPEA